MLLIPNAITILGDGVSAADIALRKVLKFKECPGALVILDYTGRGAMILNKENMMGLSHRNVAWCNLADRIRPVSLFHLRQSEHLRQVLLKILYSARDMMKSDIRDASLDWLASLGYNLSKDGTIGFGALLKSLASPETRRWFMDDQDYTPKRLPDLGHMVDMLKWIMAYPAVYTLSEGINRINLGELLKKQTVVWIEARQELFERNEHALVSLLLESAVEDAFRTVMSAQCAKASEKPTFMTVHMFPQAGISQDIPSWISDTSSLTRHVSVHRIESNRPLGLLQKAWALRASYVWLIGNVDPLAKSCHEKWLSEQEVERINQLNLGDLWLKSNKDGKAIVAKVALTKVATSTNISDHYRRLSYRRFKISPIRQVAGATQSIQGSVYGEMGLFEKLCEPDILRLGWQKVQSGKKDSHGVDSITVAMFRADLERQLRILAEELKRGAYKCRALRRVYIPKHDGSKRGLSIACVRDRVVQSACLMLLDPIFDPSFSQYSFAFRPRRSAHHAVALVRSILSRGFPWAVIADIKKCFDNIDHGVLMNLLSRRISDPDLLNLIEHWLSADLLDFHGFMPIIVGVPQGESLSPLLANIYLDSLDKHFEKIDMKFVRYADDIIILTPSEDEAIKAFHVMEGFLFDILHLEIKPASTNYAHLSDGFEYLGFKITAEGLLIRQRKMDEILAAVQEQIETLGKESSSLSDKAASVLRINASIRGFRNYFFLSGENGIAQQLCFLDGSVEQMASLLLPVKIRDDPAWICRERFLLSRTIEDVETEEGRAEREAKCGHGYPESRQEMVPSRMMFKDADDSPSPDDRYGLSVIINSGDEHEQDIDEKNNALIESGDRLYILMHGSYLTVDQGDLVIKRKKVEVYRRALESMGLIYLQAHGMNISVNLQLRLAELDIPLVFAPPVGNQIAVLNPLTSTKSFLRSRQALRRDDQDVIQTGINMLAAKMGNQAAVLQYFSKYRVKTNPELAEQLKKAAADIHECTDNVRALDTSSHSIRATAMGMEGCAANIYWRMLARLLPDHLGFSGRMKKQGSDVVNQCLNYVYGILYGETWRAIVKAGLDPYFGVIHGSKRDQGSLVFDVIEEFRAPFADRTVIGMIGRGFQPEIDNHGMLRTRTKRLLARSFSKKWFDKISWRSLRISPAEILEQQARSLSKLFILEGRYYPFKMKW